VQSKSKKAPRVGGIAFYLSLLVLAFLTPLNFLFLSALIYERHFQNLALFAASLVFGAIAAYLVLRGKSSIFVHELKHSILSNLVGNKAKKLRVEGDSGSFEFAYTKETAHMNAFIALAPYFLPLFSIVGLVLSVPFFYSNQLVIQVALGVGFGIDLHHNFKDVSPYQTDFADLTGGFKVGLIYVCLANSFFGTLILAYQVDALEGLKYLLLQYWTLGLSFLS